MMEKSHLRSKKKVGNILDKYSLTLGRDEMSLDYSYNVRAKQTGITDLLKDLKEAGLKLKDLKTEQNSLEKIFVSLVRIDNEN